MTIVGTLGSDTLIGGFEDDVLHGRAGSDTLDGGGGNDAIYGDAGDDVLASGSGSDTFYGGLGNDLAFDATESVADIASGDVAVADDTWIGGKGTDFILYEAAGLTGIVADLESGTILTGTGRDVIIDFEGLFGTSRDDVVTGATTRSYFDGRGGNDTFVYTGGEAELQGGNGFDRLDFSGISDGTVIVNLALGTVLTPDAPLVQVQGWEGVIGSTTRATVVFGTTASEDLMGGGQGDSFFGSGGSDRLTGGGGDDFLSAGSGDDLLDGGDGNDSLFSDGGADLILGGADNDTITAQGGSGDVFGGDGDDRITLRASTADVDAGTGDDVVRISQGQNNGADWIVSGGDGYDSVILSTAGVPTLDGFESITGSDFDDTVSFSGTGVAVFLGSGDDTTTAGSGNLIRAGAGDDVVTLDGASTVLGGNGADRIGDGAFGIGQEGKAVARGGNGADTIILNGIAADIFGENGADTLQGNGLGSLRSRLFGGEGDDILAGIGRMQMFGEEGDDTLICEDGVTAFGGTGDDVFRVLGDVTVLGGDGADVFVFELDTESLREGVIADFDLGADLLRLDGIDSLEALAGIDQDGVDAVLTALPGGGVPGAGAVIRLLNTAVEDLTDAIFG